MCKSGYGGAPGSGIVAATIARELKPVTDTELPFSGDYIIKRDASEGLNTMRERVEAFRGVSLYNEIFWVSQFRLCRGL